MGLNFAIVKFLGAWAIRYIYVYASISVELYGMSLFTYFHY